VWDWTETLTNGCHNVGSYRFVQSDSMFGGSFGQAGNDCSGFPNDFRGDVSNGHINGTRITFRVSASGASCDYTGDVSGNPPSAIVGTLACGAPAGTWRAHPAVPVASISVEPSNGTVVVGWTLPLKALLRNAAGERLFERAVAWTSDDPAVTTVSSAGLVTGVSAGTAGINASVEAQASQVLVTAFAIASLPMTFETVLGVEVMAVDGSGRTGLTRAGIVEPAWSPDGATLALTVMSGFSLSWWDMCAIYTVRADGSDVRHLTASAECDHSPAWSPDGTKIAFGRGDPACFWYCGVTIWIMNADGSNAMPLTGSGSGWDTRPTWSPDGTKIAFESYDWNTDHYDIYVMSADGSGAVNLTNDLGFNIDPAWSRDGMLAFVRNGDIWVMNADGSGGGRHELDGESGVREQPGVVAGRDRDRVRQLAGELLLVSRSSVPPCGLGSVRHRSGRQRTATADRDRGVRGESGLAAGGAADRVAGRCWSSHQRFAARRALARRPAAASAQDRSAALGSGDPAAPELGAYDRTPCRLAWSRCAPLSGLSHGLRVHRYGRSSIALGCDVRHHPSPELLRAGLRPSSPSSAWQPLRRTFYEAQVHVHPDFADFAHPAPLVWYGVRHAPVGTRPGAVAARA
jgi:hypothetical protein